MATPAYISLNVTGLSETQFNHHLQAFAISRRLSKVSHYRHVAEEIVRQELTTQFHAFLGASSQGVTKSDYVIF